MGPEDIVDAMLMMTLTMTCCGNPLGVRILSPQTPVKAPDALPPLPLEPEELMPELPSPNLPQGPEGTELRDEFDPPHDDEELPDAPPLVVEPEVGYSRPQRSCQPPPHLRDYISRYNVKQWLPQVYFYSILVGILVGTLKLHLYGKLNRVFIV